MTGRKVYLVGIGAGTRADMTARASAVLEKADLIAGASRMLELLGEDLRPQCVSYKPAQIRKFLDASQDWKTACILLSGDVGFYSGAEGMLRALDGYETELVPGISSLSLLCARLQIPWDRMRILSLHGRKENVIAAIRDGRYTFALLGGWEQLNEIADKLRWYGMNSTVLHIGQRLGYPDEKIFHLKPEDLPVTSPETLLCVIFENPEARSGQPVLLGDEAFIRGKVPMTKSEVRTVSIGKLAMRDRAVLYDIGAGTGSVSIQAALLRPDASVYAIERKEEALSLIEQNKRKFRTDNVTIIPGQAPECLENLPAPDCVFIGGSGGAMKEILQAVRRRNPRARIVMNLVTLESIAQADQLLREMGEEAEWVQLGVSRSRVLGRYHLMTAQNPVMIVTIPGKEQA